MWGIKDGISHTPDQLRYHLDESLKALGAEPASALRRRISRLLGKRPGSVDIFYLHAPDRNTPFEVTMKGVNDLYKEGKFKRFGLSNFNAYEVAEIVTIAKANGYVLPTVYQGIYNAVERYVSFH